MNKLSVVIMEPTKEIHSDIIDHYQRFFRLANYDPIIKCVVKEKDLLREIEENQVDVIICDILFQAEDYAGLLVLQSIKINYPDIFCIGNSRGTVTYSQIISKWPSFDLFIPKIQLFGENKKVITNLIEDFSIKFQKNTSIEISEESSLPREFKKPQSYRELLSLLAQITFTSHDHNPLLYGSIVSLTPLSGGRSKSHVFKIIATKKNSRIRTVPAVIKISNKPYAKKELDNYNRYVKWLLPYSWRVDILGTGFTKNFGAICYSFVQSDFKEFDSFTHYLIRNDESFITSIIEKIFNPELNRWYSDDLTLKEKNINERYMRRYFQDGVEQNPQRDIFIKYCQEIFRRTHIDDTTINIFGEKYPYPAAKLFGYPYGPYLSCICHGDMHSNNIIVADNKEIIFIDFQHTGRGHVFEDFIAMESSLRMYYQVSVSKFSDWEEKIDYENKICCDNYPVNLPSLYQLIAKIREYASQNFPNEPFKNYYYGLAAYNYRLLKIPYLTKTQKGRLLSSLVACLKNF